MSELKSLKIPSYLKDPGHPITIAVVGAGGTGSQLVTQLARVNVALKAVFNKSLHVTLIDNDQVSLANLGRQMFLHSDIDRYKSEVLIERVNRFFNLNWASVTEIYTAQMANIVITCTDTITSRKQIKKSIKNKQMNNDLTRPYLWIDCGNGNFNGNVIGHFLKYPAETPDPFKRFNQKANNWETEDHTPSCSIMEALLKQSLFVNTWAANIAAQLVYDVCTKSEIDWCGAFYNTNTLQVNKIKPLFNSN
jgi:PRTRC genetic system ThiF family protein